MAWTQLYSSLLTGNCVGNSLSTINGNFENIDEYLMNLSGLLFDNSYLRKNLNLMELSADFPAARANIGITGDIMAFKDQKSIPQAFVTFDPVSTFILNGETRCTITNYYNVSKVVKVTKGPSNYSFDIFYTLPLEYIGPVLSTGGEPCALVLDDSSFPSITRVRVTPSVIATGLSDNWRFRYGQMGSMSVATVISF